MTDRFSFPPRIPADALAQALGNLPRVVVLEVVPRYLLAGARWVVVVRAGSADAVAAAFRPHALRAVEWPASEVVLEVWAAPNHLSSAPPDATVARERGDHASSSSYPGRTSGGGWTGVETRRPPPGEEGHD